MSIMASITGAVVWLVCKIKRIPRRAAVWFWCLPLIRFIVPIGVSSKYGLAAMLAKVGAKAVPSAIMQDIIDTSYMNITVFAKSYNPLVYKTQAIAAVYNIAGIVWAAIAIALLALLAYIYITTKHELKDAVPQDGVYYSDKIQSPAVYGIIKPKIVLPAGCTDNLDCIILHEQAHIKRHDNLWRLVAFAVAALHWFNPFAWLFLKAYLCDAEMACDEQALSHADMRQRKAYALALLDSQSKKTVFASAFGGAKIRLRVEHIVNYKKLSVAAAVALGVFAFFIAYILLTNA